MDAVSYSLASKQAQRIEKFIENPDSTSGIVTVPKVIASGENITIPAGRIAVLPNVQVDGVLNVEGEVFIPSGSTYGDLDAKIALKQNVLVANDPAVKTALNATGAAPIYACRAWVNFNGTGTVAIRASGNVSSITDNGVGDYTVNFTTAMPDANYSVALEQTSFSMSNSGMGIYIAGDATTGATLKSTTQIRILTFVNPTVLGDYNQINISILR